MSELFKIGAFVCVHSGTRYGKIVNIFKSPRYTNYKTLEDNKYGIRYIDSGTGKLMVCPDKRHKPSEGCVICSTSRWKEELSPLTKEDEKEFRKEGLIKIK